MKPSIWIPAALTPVYLLGAYVAGDLASRGSWIDIAVPAMLLIGVPSVVLLWLAWGVLSWRAPPRAASLLVLAGIFLPFLVGGLALGIIKLSNLFERERTAGQLTNAQVFDLTDEVLLGVAGNPIGVRVRYKARFERGLDDVRFQPFATLHIASPPENLQVHRVEVTPPVSGRYERGEYVFTEEFTPSFLPRFLRFPNVPLTDDSDRCFYWGNEAARRAAHDGARQHFMVSISTYGTQRRTTGSYALADFYQGALREGAREC